MMANDKRQRVIVDIVTDPVCPWCYVGLKSWQQAQEKLAGDFEVITRFRPYELNPGVPVEGKDRDAHYKQKFPDSAKLAGMTQQLIAAATGVGAPFDPSAPKWLPNTMKAHRVLRWAHFEGLQEKLADRLYTAFWLEGADIGNPETLVQLAKEAGLNGDAVKKDLTEGKDEGLVEREAGEFRTAGVQGVPTFIVNEQHGFSGALPPEELEMRVRHVAGLETA